MTAAPPVPGAADVRKGLWLGLLGVALFALSLPMTRLAVGTAEQPQLDGLFVAMGRAVVAAALSAVYLLVHRAAWPARTDWPALAATSLGVVFGFPLLSSLAMRHVEAAHASVILGVLPLCTALAGAWLSRQRPSVAFWGCALAGTALVVSFAVLRSGQPGLGLHPADLLLLGACGCAAVGYAAGGRLATRMRAEHVISWALVMGLPLALPLAWLSRPEQAVDAVAWGGFAYVSVVSMWLGFFAWYRGLALGGTVRVSQVQLLQPFMGMLAAVPLLGERLDLLTLSFGAAVVLTVALSRRTAIRPAASATHPIANPSPAGVPRP